MKMDIVIGLFVLSNRFYSIWKVDSYGNGANSEKAVLPSFKYGLR